MVELVPPGVQTDFIGKAKVWITLSVVVLLIGLGSIVWRGGVPQGIDFSGGALAESATPDVPIVNLYRGEINGTRFSAMTVDRMRSLLGPPSALAAPEKPQKDEETHIQYHAFGLSFGMRRPSAQAPVQCWRVRIYLTKTWDAQAGTFLLPFPGRVSKQVNQDWTLQRIEAEFRQWN